MWIKPHEQRLLSMYSSGDHEAVLRDTQEPTGLTPGQIAIRGAAMMALGYGDEAAELVLAAVGDDPPLWVVTLAGQTLYGAGRLEESLAVLQSREGDPGAFPEYLMSLAIAKAGTRGLAEVRPAIEQMVELDDGRNRLIWMATHAAIQCGDMEWAWQLRQRGLTRYGDEFEGLRLSIFLSSYREESTPQTILEAAQRYGAVIHRICPAMPGAIPNNRNPDRKIRIGFVSPDFRRHVVADFSLELIRHLDRDEVSVTLYYLGTRHDEATEAFRDTADQFRVMPNPMWPTLAEKVRSDKIDVLVDLAGQTEGGAPEIAAYRAAPVNVTYLGSPTTTGVPGMDARFVDEVTDPAGAEEFVTERLVRLPGPFLCYRPFFTEVPVTIRSPGPVVFGCFGNPAKIAHGTAVAWSEILDRVPDARLKLIYHTYSRPSLREFVMERLDAAGIDAGRVDVGCAPYSILHEYADVDVALDTYPYHGTTTTCEALYMGVPVVSRLGERHVSRVGKSLLEAVGHPEWVVEDWDRYVATAVSLAEDVEARQRLRTSLRDDLLGSPLSDPQRLADAFLAAVRDLWVEWCENPK